MLLMRSSNTNRQLHHRSLRPRSPQSTSPGRSPDLRTQTECTCSLGQRWSGLQQPGRPVGALSHWLLPVPRSMGEVRVLARRGWPCLNCTQNTSCCPILPRHGSETGTDASGFASSCLHVFRHSSFQRRDVDGRRFEHKVQTHGCHGATRSASEISRSWLKTPIGGLFDWKSMWSVDALGSNKSLHRALRWGGIIP